MEKTKFEQLVIDALVSIPQKFKDLLKNITVIVEDHAPKEIYEIKKIPASSRILGLYHGVPFQHRGPFYGNFPPDVISIYQKEIEKICSNDEKIKSKVREVILHEVGHYFGMTEEHLKEIARDMIVNPKG